MSDNEQELEEQHHVSIHSSSSVQHHNESFVRTDEHERRLFQIQINQGPNNIMVQGGRARRTGAVRGGGLAQVALDYVRSNADADAGAEDCDSDSASSSGSDSSGSTQSRLLPPYLKRRLHAVHAARAHQPEAHSRGPRRKRRRKDPQPPPELEHEPQRAHEPMVAPEQKDEQAPEEPEEPAVDMPVMYVPLHNNSWQRRDPDANADICFLCTYQGVARRGGQRIENMQNLISDNYGRVSNETLAVAVQKYYNAHIRYFERDPGDEFPAWSQHMIIEHIERHAPTALGVNLRAVRDFTRMIDLLQDKALCVVDADNNKTIDQKNAKLLLQFVRERRACMREVDRLSGT